jgi:hypothetical protein
MCPDDATYLPADNWHNTKQQGKNIHGFFFYNIIFAIKFLIVRVKLGVAYLVS